MKKLILALPSSAFVNGSDSEKTLFNNISNTETHKMKLTLMLLSIFNFNMNNNISYNILKLDKINSKDSYFRPLRLSKDKIVEIIESIDCEFIKDINVITREEYCDKSNRTIEVFDKISFNVTNEYIKLLMNEKIVYIDFDQVIKYRNVNHIKAHFKAQYFSNYSANLNYLCKLFNIKNEATYSNKLTQVKRIFKAVEIVTNVELDKKGKTYNIKVESIRVIEIKKDNKNIDIVKKKAM